MIRNKRGVEQTFFIIVAAALALLILIVLIIIASGGIGGPFSTILNLGKGATDKGEFCQEVGQELCNRLSTDLKCSEVASRGYDVTDQATIAGWKKDKKDYICVTDSEGAQCCRVKS